MSYICSSSYRTCSEHRLWMDEKKTSFHKKKCFYPRKKKQQQQQQTKKLIVRFCASYIFTFWGIISYNCPNTTEEKVKIFRLINNVLYEWTIMVLYYILHIPYPWMYKNSRKKWSEKKWNKKKNYSQQQLEIYILESMRFNLFHLVRYSSINRKMKQEVN